MGGIGGGRGGGGKTQLPGATGEGETKWRWCETTRIPYDMRIKSIDSPLHDSRANSYFRFRRRLFQTIFSSDSAILLDYQKAVLSIIYIPKHRKKKIVYPFSVYEKYSCPTSFGQKYYHFSLLCKQMDIYLRKV